MDLYPGASRENPLLSQFVQTIIYTLSFMRNVLMLILCLSLLSCTSQKRSKQLNVLFIGNSLTYYNDMPQMLQKMLQETDSNINIEQITYPGFSLYAHLENIVEESYEDHVNTRKKSELEVTETEKKIQEKDWDIVIMQTGGVTVLIPEIRRQKVDPAIKEIKNLSNDNSSFYLFNTWTTKIDYPKEYCYPTVLIDKYSSPDEKICSPEIKDKKEYYDLLQSGYTELSESNKVSLTKHAQLFRKVMEEHPEIELLEDKMHPSKEGAFLSACIFYNLISGQEVKGLEYKADLDKEIADFLKKVAS